MTLIIVGKFLTLCIAVTSVEIDHDRQDCTYVVNGTEHHLLSLEHNDINGREEEEIGDVEEVYVDGMQVY